MARGSHFARMTLNGETISVDRGDVPNGIECMEMPLACGAVILVPEGTAVWVEHKGRPVAASLQGPGTIVYRESATSGGHGATEQPADQDSTTPPCEED